MMFIRIDVNPALKLSVRYGYLVLFRGSARRSLHPKALVVSVIAAMADGLPSLLSTVLFGGPCVAKPNCMRAFEDVLVQL